MYRLGDGAPLTRAGEYLRFFYKGSSCHFIFSSKCVEGQSHGPPLKTLLNLLMISSGLSQSSGKHKYMRCQLSSFVNSVLFLAVLPTEILRWGQGPLKAGLLVWSLDVISHKVVLIKGEHGNVSKFSRVNGKLQKAAIFSNWWENFGKTSIFSWKVGWKYLKIPKLSEAKFVYVW